MNWLSAIAAVSKLFVIGDCVGQGQGSRMSALEADRARAKRLAEITAHLDTLGDDELDLRLRQYQRATGRLRMGKTNHRGRGG